MTLGTFEAIANRARAAGRAVRPPQPVSVREAIAPAALSARVSLAAGYDVASCVARLGALAELQQVGSRLLIPAKSVGPRLATPTIAWLAATSAVTVGVPWELDAAGRRRWKRLAESCGAACATLGEGGWDRVALGERSEILGYVDLPRELGSFNEVVMLGRWQRRVMSGWRGVVHPHSALRAWPLGAAGDAELSLAAQARYVVILEDVGSVVAMESRDRVAAQLVAAGWERTREEAGGVEAPGPWEEPETQSLVGLAGGIAVPSQLLARVSVDDAGVRRRVERLVELLGCEAEWLGRGGERAGV